MSDMSQDHDESLRAPTFPNLDPQSLSLIIEEGIFVDTEVWELTWNAIDGLSYTERILVSNGDSAFTGDEYAYLSRGIRWYAETEPRTKTICHNFSSRIFRKFKTLDVILPDAWAGKGGDFSKWILTLNDQFPVAEVDEGTEDSDPALTRVDPADPPASPELSFVEYADYIPPADDPPYLEEELAANFDFWYDNRHLLPDRTTVGHWRASLPPAPIMVAFDEDIFSPDRNTGDAKISRWLQGVYDESVAPDEGIGAATGKKRTHTEEVWDQERDCKRQQCPSPSSRKDSKF